MIMETQQDGNRLLQTTSQISKMMKFAASKQLRCEAVCHNALVLASYCYYWLIATIGTATVWYRVLLTVFVLRKGGG